MNTVDILAKHGAQTVYQAAIEFTNGRTQALSSIDIRVENAGEVWRLIHDSHQCLSPAARELCRRQAHEAICRCPQPDSALRKSYHHLTGL